MINNNIPSESWHFYGIELDLSRYYDYTSAHAHHDKLDIFLWETVGPCDLHIRFDSGVVFYEFNHELCSVIRELDISIIMQRDVYAEWPLLEVKNSPFVQSIMSIEKFNKYNLKHFFIFTQTVVIDIFAMNHPQIILSNKAECDRKYHTKPAPIMYPPIKKPNE